MEFDWTPFSEAIRFDVDPFRTRVMLPAGPVERVFLLEPTAGCAAGFEVRGARDQYRSQLTYSYQTREQVTDRGVVFEGGHAVWTLSGLRTGAPTALVFRVPRGSPFPGLVVEVDGQRVGQIEPLERVPTKHRPGGWENRVVALAAALSEAPRQVQVSALAPERGDLSIFSVAAFQSLSSVEPRGFARSMAEALQRVADLHLDLGVDAALEGDGWRFRWDASGRFGQFDAAEGRGAVLHVPSRSGEVIGAPVSPDHWALVPWRALGEWFGSVPTCLPPGGTVGFPIGGHVKAWAEGDLWHFAKPPFEAGIVGAPPVDRGTAVLVVRQKGMAQRLFPFESGRTYELGRNPAADIVIDDPSVSRTHARFAPTPSGWDVIDLGSLNGVQVNGKSVSRYTIGPDDVVTAGPLTLSLVNAAEGLELAPEDLVALRSWLSVPCFGPFFFGHAAVPVPLVQTVRRFAERPDAADVFRYAFAHGGVGARLVALVGLRRLDPGHFEHVTATRALWDGDVIQHADGCLVGDSGCAGCP